MSHNDALAPAVAEENLVADAPYRPVPLRPGLPERLTITLWDFSWYVRTGPGEPFEDLDRAAAEAVERGYNTVRICAMPFLLFGSGIDTSAFALGPLGGEYGQRVRWYNVKERTMIDARRHLLKLFETLERHDLFVILSSWEYQQSSAFAESRDWWDALRGVPAEDRPTALAEALASLVDVVEEAGLGHRIAFTELHNEVQGGHLTEGLPNWYEDPVGLMAALRPRLEAGLSAFHERHPAHPVTVNYSGVPVDAMRYVPRNIDVFVAHPYVYGVLDEVTAAFDLRGDLAAFPEQQVRALGLLRDDAPPAQTWVLSGEDAWKMDATIMGKPETFLMDWIDEGAFDRFLYERYQVHHFEMRAILRLWLDVAADFAAARDVPLVFAEGWIGYTPLEGTFEEGPIGSAFCRHAIEESIRVGAWGTIVCSNAAPQHPMWGDVELQQQCNARFHAPDDSADAAGASNSQ
ncbi:cellulase-like family protein [Microbacterium xanthum]|uniref:cellulase-like family protein n=1 Tax=Microbacterium xanthum TaxID=3079794 RepID=UPI002AD22F3A|nr:cellulase-like family protein [Microbacterium sp. KSW-48]MDZ8171181.1 cellulase-like family protein [Microbacterium sp. KSW-48]